MKKAEVPYWMPKERDDLRAELEALEARVESRAHLTRQATSDELFANLARQRQQLAEHEIMLAAFEGVPRA